MPSNRHDPYDILIIGGGINGAGIARDAAGRGLKVLLCEQGDLGGETSSTSTKLIHGGLRYLEQYAFRLVHEALHERATLRRLAPHLIQPLRFILPHTPGMRPVWMIRAGLFLYDHLGPLQGLPASHQVDLRRADLSGILKPEFEIGFAYSDCWVDDARLVVLNALSAQGLGATILPRTAFAGAKLNGGLWIVTLTSKATGYERKVSARALVNAAGPWVNCVLISVQGESPVPDLNLVKGSHIVVPRLYEPDHAYILQNDDGRIVFMIPFEDRFTLIGTTDVLTPNESAPATICESEVAYLCRAVNRYLMKPIGPTSVVWTYSGVRPLHGASSENPSTISRDYVLRLDTQDSVPMLSVIGGKITTYRRLAERALDELRKWFPRMRSRWTATAALPGGDMQNADLTGLINSLRQRYPLLPEDVVRTVARRHGTLASVVLGNARCSKDLGRDFGTNLCGREVDYLMDREWAMTGDDILWRRTKAGLRMSAAQRAAVHEYVASRAGS